MFDRSSKHSFFVHFGSMGNKKVAILKFYIRNFFFLVLTTKWQLKVYEEFLEILNHFLGFLGSKNQKIYKKRTF